MKRVSLMAALGAAVLLAGCSATSGTATVNTSAAPMSSAAVSTPAVVSSAAGSSSSASGSAGAPAVSAPVSPASPASPAQSSNDVSPTGQDTSSSKSASTTVGDANTSLDAASAAWFSTFCGGFAPVVTLAQTAGSSIAAQAGDPAKAQAAIVDLYSSFGSAFTGTASKLKGLPPPTFDGGPAFATKVVTALQTAGPAFTADAKKIKALDVTKDPSSFSTALAGLSGDMTSALAPMQDLGSLKLTAQTQSAFEALPACAKLKAAVGG
jgi:hypothetical protein